MQDLLVHTDQQNNVLRNELQIINDKLKKTKEDNLHLEIRVSRLEKVISTPFLDPKQQASEKNLR